MATNTFPTSLQDLDATRGTATQRLNNPSHVTHHDLEDQVLEALQAKVGIDSSAVTTSLDYILKNTTDGHDHDGTDSKKVVATNLDITGLTASQLIRLNSGGTALESSGKTVPTGDIVGTTDTQTLSGKTLTEPKFADLGFIADANGNELFILDTVASAINEVTLANAATGNNPTITPSGGDTNIGLNFTPKGTGKFRITANDLDLVAATANVQVAGADPKRGMYIPVNAMWPSTTAGCAALTQVESTTNDVNIKVLDFDGAGASKEAAEFGIQTPTWWDASTLTVQFVWYATAGSGTVNWEAAAVAFSDDDALDAAYGTLQEVTDTLLATGDVHITDETAAITVAGTPVAGDWIQIRVARDPANDTNTSDARLMGVRVRFGMAQYNDA